MFNKNIATGSLNEVAIWCRRHFYEEDYTYYRSDCGRHMNYQFHILMLFKFPSLPNDVPYYFSFMNKDDYILFELTWC